MEGCLCSLACLQLLGTAQLAHHGVCVHAVHIGKCQHIARAAGHLGAFRGFGLGILLGHFSQCCIQQGLRGFITHLHHFQIGFAGQT